MPAYRPVASSNRSVYIARTRGQRRSAETADLVSKGGTAVTLVDSPDLADEIVNAHVGGRVLDRAAAKRLMKASTTAQKRAQKGKSDTGVIEQVLIDLGEAPAPSKPAQERNDYLLSYPIAAVLGAIGLFVVFFLGGIGVIEFESDLSFGTALVGMFLIAPIAGPVLGIVALGTWRLIWAMVD